MSAQHCIASSDKPMCTVSTNTKLQWLGSSGCCHGLQLDSRAYGWAWRMARLTSEKQLQVEDN